MVVGSSPIAVTSTSDIAPVLSNEFLDIQVTLECGFTLKRVRDMIRTYSQIKFLFPKITERFHELLLHLVSTLVTLSKHYVKNNLRTCLGINP